MIKTSESTCAVYMLRGRTKKLKKRREMNQDEIHRYPTGAVSLLAQTLPYSIDDDYKGSTVCLQGFQVLEIAVHLG